MKKNKIVSIILIIGTLILGGVAVFTAIKLFQLRNESVAPNVPDIVPAAGEACETVAFTVTVTSASPSTSPSPGTYSCNSTCTTTAQCQTANANYVCHTVGASKYCRHEDYLAESDCTPPASGSPTATATSTATATAKATSSSTATATATSTPLTFTSTSSTPTSTAIATSSPTTTSTSTPAPTSSSLAQSYSCNSSCTTDSQCKTANSSYICYSQTGTCRHSSYPSQSNCLPVGATNTPNPTLPPDVPTSGVGLPVIAGFGLGALLILGALVLIF